MSDRCPLGYLLYLFQAFGSPTIIAHVGERPVMLFGSDRFPVLAQVLGISIHLYIVYTYIQILLYSFEY